MYLYKKQNFIKRKGQLHRKTIHKLKEREQISNSLPFNCKIEQEKFESTCLDALCPNETTTNLSFRIESKDDKVPSKARIADNILTQSSLRLTCILTISFIKLTCKQGKYKPMIHQTLF